ncbi:MAG: hypothetical protein JRE64_02300 [Deltaproteobacteria bacterium]|nr:hypothetical protein [Deltaproteobacteria bacterium]
MNEDTQKWLDFKNKNIEPTHYKTKSVVYSNKAVSKNIEFSLENYLIRMYPFEKEKSALKIDPSEKYPPAFICEVIAKASIHQGGGNFDIPIALDIVLTWLEFDYSVSLNYKQWEKFEDKWLKVSALSMSAKIQLKYPELPKPDIQNILDLYGQAIKLNSKRAKKIESIKNNLKQGLILFDLSKAYSFLSFYKVIELVSDDLASKKYVSNDSIIAKDLVKYQLIKQGSQRAKIYYLLNAIENSFLLDEMVILADDRNNLAHDETEPTQKSLENCQKLAFWAGEKFMRIAVSKK